VRAGSWAGLPWIACANWSWSWRPFGVGPAFLRGDTIAVVRGEVAVSIRLQSDQVSDRPTQAPEPA
jgi:hypothetical protein